jgi:serine/threonine protein kinase
MIVVAAICFGKNCRLYVENASLYICTIISSVWQMTTAISIEDVRREVKILKALSGHKHLVKFHDACEDANNVYIVMEYVFSRFLFYFFIWNMV